MSNENNILDTLYPIMATRLDEFFPEMQFRLVRGKWVSHLKRQGKEPKHPNAEKTYSQPSKGYYTIAEQGEEPISYIDYQIEKDGGRIGDKGEAFISALRALCEKAGIPFETNSKFFEKAQKERERLKSLEDVCNEMRNALLFNRDADDVRQYLKDSRKYCNAHDEKEIDSNLVKEMGIGYISISILPKLKEAMGDMWNDAINSKGIGTIYRLAIPCRYNGKIVGFNFRKIDSSNESSPKYLNTFKPGEKGQYLFGMSPISPNRSEYKDLTIVEGEMDALHASALGLPNIVAMGGSSMNNKVLKEIKKKGFDKINILLDSDIIPQEGAERDKAEANKVHKIRAILDQLNDYGLKGYVATLPGDGTEKIDVDSFLLNHSCHELQTIIDEATSGGKYLYFYLKDEACKKEFTDKVYSKLKEDVIDLLIWCGDNTEDKNYIKADFASSIQIGDDIPLITESDIQKRLDELSNIRYQQEREKRIKSSLYKASEIESKEGTEAAFKYIEGTIDSLNESESKQKFSNILNDDIDAIFESFKHQKVALKSGFWLGKTDAYEFLLPSGAITVVAAPTGHGKSKMLQSMAVNIIERNDDDKGSVLYITYEESKERIIQQFVNIITNETLTKKWRKHGNLENIENYLSGRKFFIQGNKIEKLKEGIEKFKDIYKKGLLKIVQPEDNYLTTIVKLLRYAINTMNIKVVFIDYVQEIYLENSKANMRSDELKQVMVEIDRVAHDAQIPIVVAAQMNRVAETPLEMANQQIADSSWIERKASEILLLWSSRGKCLKDSDGSKAVKANQEIGRGMNIGSEEQGKIYGVLTKSRLTRTGIDAVFDIEGNIGKIKPNTPDGESSASTEPDDF